MNPVIPSGVREVRNLSSLGFFFPLRTLRLCVMFSFLLGFFSL
jgi:hypothetical protein